MTVYLDTSALYALLDRDDANHSRALTIWNRLLDEDTALLTNNYVLVESTALAQRRLGTESVRAIHEDVVPLLTIDWISEARHNMAAEALLIAGRHELSLVDCSSFQTMRARGVRRVFGFDLHFREQGFEVVT